MITAAVEWSQVLVPPLWGLVTSFLGAVLGYALALRHFRKERRQDFVKQQVALLYSPMVGCIKRIRASSELRVELSTACGKAWQKICQENPKPFHDHRAHFEPFKRSIEYENERFPRYLLPLYDEMVDIFTRHFWLAEVGTREFYGPFCRYVELWHRFLDDSIPEKVLEELEIEEDSLLPFYSDLERHLLRLRAELAHSEEAPYRRE